MNRTTRTSLLALVEGGPAVELTPATATRAQTELLLQLRDRAATLKGFKFSKQIVELDDALLLPKDSPKLAELRSTLQQLRRSLVRYTETLDLMRLDDYRR